MAQNGQDLERFVRAQEQMYAVALSEIRGGCKRSHWIWYIFPQLRELGYSANSKYFGISGLAEARDYLAHPVLGPRLEEITRALLTLDSRDPLDIMGYPDNLKLRSCMTLFARASEGGSIYERVIQEFYGGVQDAATLRLLNVHEGG